MSDWQPIETAPMDGLVICVWDKSIGYVPWVYFQDGEWISQVIQWTGDPTHWMPLPDPPKE